MYPGNVNDDTAGKDMMTYMNSRGIVSGVVIGSSSAEYGMYIYARSSFDRDFAMRVRKYGGVSFMYNQEHGVSYEASTWHDVQFQGESYTKTECDNKYALKTSLNNYYTKTDCDLKFAPIYPMSHTITHYAKMEDDIVNYTIGKPVFMSGRVYKRVDNDWIESTVNDTEDCICGVVSTGTHKTYVGIITRIDEENHSLTFASHGDYLFTVDDSSKYAVGDVVLYDGSVVMDNILPTMQIMSSIIGKVSGIIDKTHIAVFKST